MIAPGSPELHALRTAVQADNPNEVRELLNARPGLKQALNEPLWDFDSPLLHHVRSTGMLDLLLNAGADLAARSRWWAGGFSLLEVAPLEVARHALKRGAAIDIHAAARLDLLDEAQRMLGARPELVHARAGDGQTPLHYAPSIPMAELLLKHGADLNARDRDHESTPAQYMLDGRLEVARFLVSRGARTDILLAAALGDCAQIRSHLEGDPSSIRTRVDAHWFPMSSPHSGGIIYQWLLGPHYTAHQAARKFGQGQAFQLLWDNSPADLRLVVAALLEDSAALQSELARNPPPEFHPADLNLCAVAARNNKTTALRLLVQAGLPPSARGQHRGTPLHWAAWHGNAPMVEFLLQHQLALEDSDNDFHCSPLQWALHGSENGWHKDTGDYPRTVQLLLRAGAKLPAQISGTPAVQQTLREWKAKGWPRGA